MRSNPVRWFEIPVRDMDRTASFYERLFSVTLERIEIDGNAMALFPSVDGAPGASGALACGDSYTPGAAGARLYFGVDDIDATLRTALELGARPHYPITSVEGVGFVAEFLDPEGNCIALHAATRA
jgi:predicted enzyme related to lactoylglutathione lyase